MRGGTRHVQRGNVIFSRGALSTPPSARRRVLRPLPPPGAAPRASRPVDSLRPGAEPRRVLSGLDAAAAFHVTAVLKKLAGGGRTVVAVIHQPASEVRARKRDESKKNGQKIVPPALFSTSHHRV